MKEALGTILASLSISAMTAARRFSSLIVIYRTESDSYVLLLYTLCHSRWGAVAGWVRALDWRPGGPGFRIPLRQLRFGTLAIPFTQLCQCLSEESLKAVGPFYLVSMPGEVKDSTSLHWKCVTCHGLHHS